MVKYSMWFPIYKEIRVVNRIMKKSFKVFPHVAYLNNEVSITNISDWDLEVYDNDKFITTIQPHSVYKTQFPAGNHKLTGKHYGGYFLEDSEEFIIEDAIKLGGGKIIDGYIFHSWILVKMTDRMYFHNTITNEEVVEMNLVPDAIQSLSQDLLLFWTKSEGYSIYSLSSLNTVAKFQNAPIYIGQNSLVYLSSNDTISIFYYYGATCQDYKYCKYALNQSDNVLHVYADDLMFHVNLITNTSSINLFVDDPVLNIMGNGCYACLSRQNNINQIVVYRIDSHRDVRIDSINLNPNTISVGEISLVSNNFKEDLKTEYDKLRTTLNNLYASYISIDFKYSEILDVFATCTDTCYTVRETFKTKYGTAEEYRLIIPRLKEDIKISAYSKIHLQDDSIFLELNSEIIILYKNTIRRVTGKLIKYNNRYYVLSISGGTKLISTIEGDILHEGNFELSTIAYSLAIKKNDSINLFEKFGWVVDTIEGKVSLMNAFNKACPPRAFDSIYFAKNSIVYKNDGKYYSVTSDSYGTPVSIHNDDFSNVICIADSGNGTLNNIDGKIFHSYHSIFENSFKDKVILSDIFDHSAYSEALFANDGESVVYADKKGNYFLHNLVTDDVTEFNSGKFIKHINGYSPQVNIDSNRIPRIINPLTGRFVESRLFDYTFASPDGNWVVITPENKAKDSVGGIECHHKGTGKEISHNEYHTYHFQLDTGCREASQQCIAQRKEFIKDYPSIFVPSIQQFLSGSQWDKLKIDAVNLRRYVHDINSVDRRTAEAIEHYLKYYRFFTGVIFDIKEYVYIKNDTDTSISKIEIGRPLWFINYISFSYDSRYVAIAGRYEDDTEDENHVSLGGLFLLYDLVENKVVTKKTNSQAVWVTSFTPSGNVGLYDSRPTTYITSTDNSEIISIAGRSFLTFSPSGKFFALSNQGYVRYDNVKYNQVAGHQPSTNVYIRHINDLKSELAHFNDHGDKITGVLTKRQKTVAMVAFSPDDKKLMSVSDDGVIVIRNLHL